MTQFKDKSASRARRHESVSVGLLRLPGADGLRHLVVRHGRGARRRRPAPARRARARRRDPVQRPLRRHVRRARRRRSRRSAPGSWTCSGPSARCRSRRTRRRARSSCSIRPKTIEKKIKSAVTDSGSEVRHDRDDEAGRVEPDRDLRRGHRRARSPRSNASSTASSTACSRSRSPKPSSSSCDRCRTVTQQLAADPAEVERRLGAGAARGRSDRRSRARPRELAPAGPAPPPLVLTRPSTRAALHGAARVASVLPARCEIGEARPARTSPRSLPASSSRLTVPPPARPGSRRPASCTSRR